MVNRMFFFLALLATPAWAEPPVLQLPMNCTLNQSCFIQQYVDVDETSGVRDFAGGSATYDGHKGTDIRLTTEKEMTDGVDVIASAPGRVLGVRDGVVDRAVRTDADREAVKKIECGNGVVVDHGDGWQTQYCHMKQGSIAVAKGQLVQAGDVLGQVGLSGQTQFAHVHISVRKAGKKIDPFKLDNCLPSGKCNLWAQDLQSDIAYQPTQIINIGFANGRVSLADIEAAGFAGFIPEPDTPALVGYVRAINLVKGDQIRLVLSGPNGGIVAKTYDPMPRNKAVQMYFAGRKKPTRGWPEGIYTVQAQVLRNGETVERLQKSLNTQ
jgi:murein DD-endopeptidase MepM/ murein hydrolase activator NlpD